ncbi:MAG: YbaB/EbfC family nucleoid-associated protein [Elusimicrobia bacterium]|jgi:DNA-binding protein YbaB|nr:YbaB/EbfC family nucleoid-associated protein [Elusimicrobiota bacterium]MBK7544869.1 YbaB/EbfC family nucleoid-associated protein [Elusimicrobiota bacterium]MBK7574381.1 YbaB/EbfC family nucleoid-associated protein [Elusimicrobiota bacterium]MBK8126527.1 YbaB/EbfC family nucleoid-associated protein [Elusimicrobiota bacterium]MBK8423343.1 YbaB/EbfC family nucleoid-associated protein [Elusimicrobiota bacterium]
MFEKMKQLMDMQKFAKEAERRLGDIRLEREGLGGKLRASVSGNQVVHSLSIDESLLAPVQKGALERALVDLLNGALSDAKAEGARAAMDLMKGLRGG